MKSVKCNQLIMFLFGLLCLVACEDPDIPNINDENQQNSKPTPEIKIDVSSVDFGSEGGSDTISFTSTDDWTAELINSRADDWCSITPKTGKAGSAKISVTLQQNETTDNRSASIIIKSGSVNKTVTVNQKQKDALTITASKFEVGPEGGEITIEVKANIDFEYEIEGSAQEWISYQTTRAMKTSTLVFNVTKNDNIEKREGKIHIKSGEFNEILTVFQEGEEPSIILTENEFSVSSEANTIAVEVKSNVDVTVEIPEEANWISENITRAFSTNTYYFSIDQNDGYETRTAKIKFINKDTDLSEYVTVTQLQKDAIVLAKSEYEFGVEGGSLYIEILTNVDINVNISDNANNWIQQIETRSLESKTLQFNIASCSAEDDREGTITLYGGNVTQIITVKQNGLKEILEKERKALIEFYIAAGGDNWVHKDNWCSDKPISEWFGITCDKTGRVYSIFLTYNNLSGYLSESICKLNNLRGINLGQTIRGGQVYDRKDMNSIIIRIPEQINECKELTEIDFSGLTLEGEIPSSFSELTKLTYIRLCQSMSNNTTGLTGEIPDLNKMENLSLLDLSHNSLTGEIPNLQKNRKLTNLELSNNSLTGEIPDFTNHLQLKWIALSNNNLYGRLPEFSSTKLQWLKLSNNNLEDSIPASYAVLLKQLVSLNLYNNRLSGKLPEEILISPEFPLFVSSFLAPQQDGYGIDISEIPAVKNTYATIDGGTVNLGETYAKNKYTILYRWNETCPYGYLSTPIVVNTYNKYKDKGLGVLGFYTGSNQDNNKDYMISTGMDSWTHVAELQENYAVTYGDLPIWLGVEGSYSTPLIEVVDSYGNLIFVSDESFTNLSIMHPRDELPEFIETLLGSNGNEEIYNSKDFSSDGIVKNLQKASKGNGINIILMGDGYSDRLIADGTYYSDMETMVDAFFHEEPYKSHKDLFNIYVVYAVSKNEVYTTGTSTAIECKFGEGTYVEGKHSKCIEYALKAISESQMNEALILVGINRIKHSGTCHMFLPENNGDYASGLSISYFSVMDPYQLRLLVSHEAGGHGFAKLGDEYWYEDNGRIPSDVLNQKLKESRDFGWWRNIDFTNDPNKVKWSHFLCDDRYIPENLGVFEGGSTYTYGVYRSTENSVMRNSQGYNAPSREAIYYRIHKLAYGLDWQYNFEDFVESDLINRESSIQTNSKTTQKSKVNYVEVIYQNPPVIINQTWRDAMKYTDSYSERCR